MDKNKDADIRKMVDHPYYRSEEKTFLEKYFAAFGDTERNRKIAEYEDTAK